ncbi:DUF2637 domain-containing protein [Spirillospora sp. CA-253888]
MDHGAPGSATVPSDAWTRLSTNLVVIALAIGAAYVSYGHAYDLIRSNGESGTSAVIGAATVDGLVYATGMVIRSAWRRGVRAPLLAYVGAAVGMAATIGANVAHGWSHGPIGSLVSAWPAVALIIAYEVLMRQDRATAPAPVEERPAATENQCPHGVAGDVRQAAQNAFLHSRDCVGEEISQRRLAAAFDVDRKKLAAWLREVAQPDASAPDEDAPEPAAVNRPAPRPINGVDLEKTGV